VHPGSSPRAVARLITSGGRAVVSVVTVDGFSKIKLTKGCKLNNKCHLDPDLDKGATARPEGWLPAFGQNSSAEGHLRKQRVAVGDLFLFFGWFRKAEQVDRKWHYVPGAPDRHVIYGYMQIGEIQ
jgi:hypothetical protein